MKYELTTLRDVFEKVPADRIDECLSELAIAMKQAKAMQELLSEVGKAVSGSDDVAAMLEWPEPATWIDDGKGEIELNFHKAGKEDQGIVLTTKLSNGA